MGSMYVRRAFLATAIFALAVFVAACGGGKGETGGEETTGAGGASGGSGESLTVASDIAYRPFEFVQDGEPVGFDVDLINEIGDRAGYEINLQNVVFDGVIEGVGNGLYDAGISAMTINPEREQSLTFSDPYFNADQSLLVQSGSDIQTTDDLADSLIGAQRGTTGEALSRETAEEVGAEVRSYTTVEDAFSALENGQVDAVINDFPVSAARVQQTGDALEIVDTIETGEQYGIAFPPDSELVGPFNEALQEIKDDGTYAEIYEEWFGQEPESIP